MFLNFSQGDGGKMLTFDNSEQGSESWLLVRRGACTGSRFKDARDKLKSGLPSKACTDYARDLARERLGGMAPAKFQSAAMRKGTEEEPKARIAYETETGFTVREAGFFKTEDGLFGGSVDGLIDDDGVLEIKTMVSSDTLYTAFVDGDISAYIDQCNGYLWLLGRKWVDLVLWCPDLNAIKIHRITRDEEAIAALEHDLMTFSATVKDFENKLRRALASNPDMLLKAA
jgi:exodeoxyribonuclease (lambda-induced)